jgi:hypothetical protein
MLVSKERTRITEVLIKFLGATQKGAKRSPVNPHWWFVLLAILPIFNNCQGSRTWKHEFTNPNSPSVQSIAFSPIRKAQSVME